MKMGTSQCDIPILAYFEENCKIFGGKSPKTPPLHPRKFCTIFSIDNKGKK